VVDPKLTELLSVCRRLIEDGVLLDSEVHYLNRWLQQHSRVASRFPGQQIGARLKRIFADGVISDEERSELLALLRKATRESSEPQTPSAPLVELALTNPPPPIEFLNRHFCLTGRFYGGSVKWCRHQIEKRGGDVQNQVDASTDYLLIGAAGDTDPGVVKAAPLFRETLKIISEAHWLRSLT
jgi:NAD-dependent DNA ligase